MFPAEVERSVRLFLTIVDELSPGLITGFYLVGSLAFNDFRAHGVGPARLNTASDIDFVAVTERRVRPDTPEMAALAEAHTRTVTACPRPHFDGVVLTPGDLAAGPDDCPDAPCAQQSRFTTAGRAALDPVTFSELAKHGITVRGPRPADLDVRADPAELRDYTAANLRGYWRPWWQANRRIRPLPLAVGCTPWFPVWAVLGVSRLHHVLATGELTSKTGAGRYALAAFDPRWRRIIEEGLSLRTNGEEGRRGYRNAYVRRRDTLAFLDHAIDEALTFVS